MAAASGNKVLLVIPGTLFWVLVIVGATTGNGTLTGAAVVLAVLTVIAVVVTGARASGRAAAARDAVWATGTPATATVVRVDGTGATINNDLEVDLVVDVVVAGRPPHRATIRRYVSPLAIPRVQPGCSIDARVDPANPAAVVLDPDL